MGETAGFVYGEKEKGFLLRWKGGGKMNTKEEKPTKKKRSTEKKKS